MKINRTLLTLGLSCWLAAPASAQWRAPTPAPEAAPAAAPESAPPVAPAPDAAGAPAAAPDGTMPAPEAAPGATPSEAAPVPPPEATPPPAPPPPAAAPPTPPAPPPAAYDDHDKEEAKCAFGELCVGPVITLGVINPIGFGAHARYGKYVGFGLDYQFLPKITVGDAAAGWSLFTVEGRLYPLGGAFWVGAGFGYQTFSASVTAHSMSAGDLGLKGTLGMPAIKLGLGLMGHDGFVMGIDLAANIPLGGSKVSFGNLTGPAASTPEGMMMSADLHDKIDKAAKKAVKLIPVIPQINLIRIGYLF
jgi:hypothetical protein